MENQSKVFFQSRALTLDCVESEEDQIKYRNNGDDIENEEHGTISDEEFITIIKKEIAKFINPFDNLVILAGAGASIVNDDEGFPDKKYGHTIAMLAESVDEFLETRKDLYSIEKLSEMCKYSEPLKIKSAEEGKNPKIKYNPNFILENFLSKVLSYEEFLDEGEIKEKFKLTKEAILEVIVEKTSYSFEKGIHKHDAFIKVFSNMVKTPSRLSIVTTNYDTLFEDAADVLNFTVFDGFSFTSNPRFDVDMFDWSLVKPILNVKSDKVEYKKSVINLVKIHGSLNWKQENEEIIRCNKDTNNNPLMIFPSSNKYSHSYEKPYFELLSKFQELLKVPNTLFLTTGFSFADNHIAKMITQAVKSNPSLTLLVTDYSIDTTRKNSNWSELYSLMKNGYRIAFLRGTLADGLTDYFGTVKHED
ncbi:SIR2 family protein [Facklamia sp. 7083-14-GEN3]|uniref:SIR2 family protein n=1 Tax=Facklamia sp. 7083-14-GEN3 TaxID=2973478 RepID=UPI00215D4734|nr:SIR2 family protein [Facklamia sp. 7083-14-GEN3]MCR8969784.1 SIR2 family protein [Facklamia sp. 7083-14-GEN3]